MAIQRLTAPLPLRPPGFGEPITGAAPAFVSSVVDAAGEYVDMIGMVHWDGLPSSAKTVSNAGGKVVWRTGAVTWATLNSTLRISIQDLNLTTGLPPRGDGTDDVHLDIVQGTTALAANTTYSSGGQSAFTTGSKSIAHGQLIAIRFALTVRNGTDLVNINSKNATRAAFPLVVHNTTSVATVAATPNVMLVADDGTVGWLAGSAFVNLLTTRTYDSAPTPDEYGNTFQFPIGIEVCGLQHYISCNTGTGAGTDFSLFTDPLGTPVIAREYVHDQQHFVGATAATSYHIGTILFDSPIEIAANTKFALTARPQDTTSDLSTIEHDYVAFADAAKAWAVLGGNAAKVTRTNDTGALTETAHQVIPIWPLISGIDIPSAGGGLALPPVRAVA